MKENARKFLKPLLLSKPDSILASAFRQLTYLFPFLPRGLKFRWPYYLGDVSVLIDTSNSIEAPMLSGTYDVELSRAIHRFVKQGSYCVDIGANVGPVTLLLAKLVGATGRVLAIEPGSAYCRRLNDNLNLNPELKKRVTLVNIGLSDVKGSLFWEPDPKYPYNAGLSADRLSHSGVSVHVDTLDAVIEQQGWRQLDFIKIDVEGMEFEVFRGSLNILLQYKPVVLFETLEIFRKKRNFDPFTQIEDLLNKLDYKLYRISPEGDLEAVNLTNLPSNTLAIPCRN